MSDVRFEVKTDLAVLNQITLEANFEQLDESLELMMADYQNMVVTPDSLALAKAERAKIRKTIEQIEDARKTVARIYRKPLDRFEDRVKQSLLVCDKAANHLDKQIKFIMNEDAKSKLSELEAYFEEHRTEDVSWMTFEAIQNPKWKNVTFKTEEAKKEIDYEISKAISDQETIRGLESEFETELLLEYQDTRNLSEVIRKNTRLIQSKRAKERYAAEVKAKQEAAERTSKEEAEAVVAEKKESGGVEEDAFADKTIFDILLRVQVTSRQLQALVTHMRQLGISFSRVKEEEQQDTAEV